MYPLEVYRTVQCTVYCLGYCVLEQGEDDGVHRAGAEQAQVGPGRRQGALQVLHLQGEVLHERPAPAPPLRVPPRQDRIKSTHPAPENDNINYRETFK